MHYFIFWLNHMACGILVPQPGVEPMLPAVEGMEYGHVLNPALSLSCKIIA